MARWYSANVLQTIARRTASLAASPPSGRPLRCPTATRRCSCQRAVPAGSVGKDWQTLFRRKLNVAWLPSDKVFLRAVHLPAATPAEIAHMVELQLEKLSPAARDPYCLELLSLPQAGGQTRRFANGHCHHRRAQRGGGIPGEVGRRTVFWPTGWKPRFGSTSGDQNERGRDLALSRRGG